MQPCFPHVKDDSNPPRARSPASDAEVARRRGRDVFVGLPAGGGAKDCRASEPGADARSPAAIDPCSIDGIARGRGAERARRTVIVLDASAAIALLMRTRGGVQIEARVLAPTE